MVEDADRLELARRLRTAAVEPAGNLDDLEASGTEALGKVVG
jgi:hypothetical protein